MKKLILISGISGAGKTSASNILEDIGYTCIDQFPSELINQLIDLISNDNGIKYEKVALCISLLDFKKFHSLLTNAQLELNIILLNCKKEVIMNRYKFSRRCHPLMMSNTATSIEEAYDIEENILKSYKKEKCHIIDTSNLTTKQLKIKLDRVLNYTYNDNLAITFESFGYKNGVPDDADLVIDTRILTNPFYVKELKDLTGNEKEVSDYVLNNSLSQKYLKKLISYLDFYFSKYKNQDRRHLMICIGCTGGQHRSVAITNYLFEHYRNTYNCYINHREIK